MRLARHRWSLLIAVCLLVDAYIVWFQPQHTTLASLARTAQLCKCPAATAVAAPSEPGTAVCPWLFTPQHTTLASLARTAQL